MKESRASEVRQAYRTGNISQDDDIIMTEEQQKTYEVIKKTIDPIENVNDSDLIEIKDKPASSPKVPVKIEKTNPFLSLQKPQKVDLNAMRVKEHELRLTCIQEEHDLKMKCIREKHEVKMQVAKAKLASLSLPEPAQQFYNLDSGFTFK